MRTQWGNHDRTFTTFISLVEKMKPEYDICLIRPPAIESFRFSTGSITLPLGLAYIAAALEKTGRKVHFLDAVALAPKTFTGYLHGFLVGLKLEDIVSRIPKETRIIGISSIFTHEWPMVAHLAKLIKRSFSNSTIVLGGEHITAMPEFSLLTSGADVAVLGEGEETIVELVESLENGFSLDTICGISYRDGDQVQVNPRRRRATHLDEIAQPAWHLVDIKTYDANRFVGGMDTSHVTIPILATRGCPYQCTFCASPNMWTTEWVPRDPIKVVDEMEYYYKTYGARNFPFQDLTAIIRKDWTVNFCKEILKRELDIFWQFPSGTRSEAIDDEVAALMRNSGMISMGYAPESGSDRTREYIKKKVHADALFKSIRSAKKAGLNISSFFILGFPHDTRESIKENFPFMKKLANLGVNDVAVGIYLALPGTELFNSLYDAGKLKLDHSYFGHIIQGSALIPAVSHNDAMTRFELGFWRLLLNLAFYREKGKRPSEGGFIKLLAKGFRGIFVKGHSTRLETALRNGINGGITAFKCKLKLRWMARKQEIKMMDSWDIVFRNVLHARLSSGCMSEGSLDTTLLYKSNAIKAVRHLHKSKWAVAATSTNPGTEHAPKEATSSK